MAQNYKKLLENIYFAARHHKELNDGLARNLQRDERQRAIDNARYEAYAYIVQMVNHSDTIGKVDYKKVHKMKGELPYIYT